MVHPPAATGVLDALMSDLGRKEIGDMTREAFNTLQQRFKDANIDIANAKLVRVEETGSNILSVDVFLSHEERSFHFHFGVMTLGGGYDFTGHSTWFKWDDEADDS